jgi:hypothetical protein
MLSPDRRAILVVEDAVSIEADPLPDGFLYASEATGAVVQIDSVWDVAPSPDWTRIAFGRAYVLNARERDTMPPEEWLRLEARLPEDVADRDAGRLRRALEANAFPVSGMALMLGLGLTQVIWVDRLTAGRTVAPVGPTHSLNGWRVRWAPRGDTLGAGAAPTSTYDDAPPSRWVLVRPRLWAVYRDSLDVTTDSTRFVSPNWTQGPTMELASPIDLSPPSLTIDAGTVAVHEGIIRLTARRPDGRTVVRDVGPGIPLAATASGRYILALVARSQPRSIEMAALPTVYHVLPR